MTTSIEITHVTYAYGRDSPVIVDASLAIRAGTFLAIAGPNGAGKSTLLNLLAGVLRPQTGTILLEGKNLRSYSVRDLARRIAIVRPEFVPVFGFSVFETVLMARTPHYGQLGFESREDRRLARRALDLTDTARFASRPLWSLSSGERQRVFIARALAQDTDIVLLDEPTSFLDLRHQVEIYDLLKSIQSDHAKTIVAVTHDINLATQYCDKALLLYPAPATPDEPRNPDFRIGETSQVLTPEEIERAFHIKVWSGQVGRERCVIPLGYLAKDARLSHRTPQ